MTATTERPKLEVLRAKEAELAIEVDAVRARIAEYPDLLHDARSRAVYAKPNVRPGAELNGEVAKITARERKDVAALNGLEGDLSAIRSVINAEAARMAEEETAEARAQLEQLHKREEGVWVRAGELFGDLAGVWNELVEIVEEESQVATANRLEAPGVLAVEPVPPTFKSFLLLLHIASTDPEVRAEPHKQQLMDSGIFGRRDEHGNALPGAYYDTRPAGMQTTEVRRRLDEHDRLFHLIPALGSIVRALQLNVRVPTIDN
jgi:hypothetical protein